MDEVRSYVHWTSRQIPARTAPKTAPKDRPASFSKPMMEGPGADSEETHEPVSDIDTDQWIV